MPLAFFLSLNMQGSSILQVTAIDQDEGVDDDIILSISSGNTMINGTASFAINESTGWITVNIPQLDREEVDEYTLTIMVTKQK